MFLLIRPCLEAVANCSEYIFQSWHSIKRSAPPLCLTSETVLTVSLTALLSSLTCLHLHIVAYYSLPPHRAVSSQEKKKSQLSSMMSPFMCPSYPQKAPQLRCASQGNGRVSGYTSHWLWAAGLAVTVESANSVNQQLIIHPGNGSSKQKAKALKRIAEA